jgi:hypothetical protein
MAKIEWMQVIVAFILGVLLSATAKAMVSHLRTQASGAIG